MKRWAAALIVLASFSTQAQEMDESSLRSEVMEGGTAKDFLVTDTGAIYVGVLDDGSSRNGYARYVCEVARAHSTGSSTRLIKIIDIAAVSRGEGFRELGRHRCDI